MMQHLKDQQIHILNFILYDRQCPPVTSEILAKHLTSLEANPVMQSWSAVKRAGLTG